MDEKQVRKTIRGIQKELESLEVTRAALEDAIASLQRLLPADPAAKPVAAESNGHTYPGLTDGILQIIAEGRGRPVPVGVIRESFRSRGWLISPEGADRSQTIYETLRRLHKESNRIVKLGKEGYVIRDNGQAKKNSLVMALRGASSSRAEEPAGG